MAKVKRLLRGNLLLRGKNYYVKFCLNGNQILKVLKDDQGNPIKNKRDAEKAKKYCLRLTISVTSRS